MAAYDTSRPFAASGSAPRHATLFTRLFGAVAAWNDARLTRKSLNALSERELQDIGLTRAEIEEVATR